MAQRGSHGRGLEDSCKCGDGPLRLVALDEGENERESIAPGPGPDRIAANNRLARRLEKELARVPDTNRAAFELVHGDGLTAAEAAEVLGTTSMAVRLRVHRAYEALREALGDQVREELGESP